jgi:hypothetical protein
VDNNKTFSDKECFEIESSRFCEATGFALKVSSLGANRAAALRFVLGSFVFTRTCVTAETVLHLLTRGIDKGEPNTLDHFSIAVLCRNMIEAAVMLHYLTEPDITEAQWDLRRKVLDLHDCLVRTRLFKGFGANAKDEYIGWKKRSDQLRKEIMKLSVFKKLTPERQEKIFGGSELYVEGVRKVLGQFDIDKKYFDAIYNYLSGQVHISSNTFYFMHKGRIDFTEPAAYQFYIAAFAIANARYFLLPAALRMASSDDYVLSSLEKQEIQAMKELSLKKFGELD